MAFNWETLANSSAGNTIATSLTNVFSTALNTTLERNGLVKQGPAPTGNLSASQIAAGQVPGSPSINQNNPNAGGLMNSIGFGGAGGMSPMVIFGGVAVLGLVAFLALKK